MKGRVVETDRDLHVYVHDDAVMTVPKDAWLYQLNHTRPEPNRLGKCDDRMIVVGSLESYLYLISECTKEEAWHRIKILRKAVRENRKKTANAS